MNNSVVVPVVIVIVLIIVGVIYTQNQNGVSSEGDYKEHLSDAADAALNIAMCNAKCSGMKKDLCKICNKCKWKTPTFGKNKCEDKPFGGIFG